MEFATIFAPYLYSVILKDETDEFTLFINFLTDAIQLEEYFNENQDVLGYYNLTIEDAVLHTIEIAEEIYDYLEKNKNDLNKIFEPLTYFGNNTPLGEMKYKIDWIRLYAIQIELKHFAITGGAIKQSQKMQEHPETQKQLYKMRRVRDCLSQQGIIDFNGFFELINE
ncbi:MAG: hypothetical protein V4643_06300 [Bacteroidota bacterium]